MLLLFASCLNCSVHGAFLFCGEKLLQFIVKYKVKYKAVSVRLGGQWLFRPACQENPSGSWLVLQKVLENRDIWECCDPGNSPHCGTDSVGVHFWEMCLAGLCVCL